MAITTTLSQSRSSLLDEDEKEEVKAVERQASVYNASSIVTFTGLDAVRNRPTAYFRDLEIDGQNHSFKEIADNSLDEVALHPDGFLHVTICRDPKRRTYQFIIRDNGRGIPLEQNQGKHVFISSATELNTSGKYNTSAYITSSGSFGMGLKAAAGTSLDFRLLSSTANGTGSLYVHKGKFDPTPNILWRENANTGVTVVYEPDPEIFMMIPEYAETGYGMAIDLMRQYVFFRHYNIVFRVSETPVPPEFYTAPIDEALAIVANLEANANVVFDSKTNDADEWIHDKWGLNRPFAWKAQINRPTVAPSGLRDFIIKMYHVKYDRQGGTFGLVNNVPISGLNSDHLSVAYKEMNEAVAERIADQAIRKFFLDSYKLPLFLAVDVKYEGAKFGGTTKDTFRNPTFRELFKADLDEWRFSDHGKTILNNYFEMVHEDIVSRYNDSLNVKIIPKDRGRLALRLNRPDKFKDCKGRNPELSELFLVEGESAGGSAEYDIDNQAIYKLGGKPLNAITRKDEPRSVLVDRFMANKIYADILTIIGYDLKKRDLKTLNFKRCLVMSDADSHGRHIAAIIIGNFYAVAPELVESGFFGIVAPPYYEVYVGKDRSKSVYIRDQQDIVQWCTRHIYFNSMKIDIGDIYNAGPRKTLTLAEYLPFAETVHRIGDILRNLSEEMSASPYLLEGLTRCTHYLTPQTMNVDLIREELGADRVHYDAGNNALVLTIGLDDIVLPLHQISDRFYEELIPELNRIKWSLWQIYITTQKTATYKEHPITIYQLYKLFKQADSLLTVRTLKGIGSMKPHEAARTCMDPRCRRVYTITSPGQADLIYDLLGDQSGPRKKLLDGNSSISKVVL